MLRGSEGSAARTRDPETRPQKKAPPKESGTRDAERLGALEFRLLNAEGSVNIFQTQNISSLLCQPSCFPTNRAFYGVYI